jgi:hypothetical protein
MGENDSGFRSLKKKFVLCIPDKLKIHEVAVVPIFDPNVIAIVCESFIIPEFTNPTSITDTAEELCTAIVIPIPSKNPLIGLEVSCSSNFSNFPPEIFSKPADITIIPYKKKANPPHNVKIENISISLPP